MADNAQQTRQREKPPYIKEPRPIILKEDEVVTATTKTLYYQNAENETSEIRSIKITAPPLIRVTVRKTVNNEPLTIVDQRTLADIPDETIDFKRFSTDGKVNLGYNQYLYIDVEHSYQGNVSVLAEVDRDKLIWTDRKR